MKQLGEMLRRMESLRARIRMLKGNVSAKDDLTIARKELRDLFVNTQESPKSPYVNLIAVREQDKDKPWVAKLVKAYESATRLGIAFQFFVGMTTALVLFALSRPAYRRIVAQRDEILSALASR